ncbi:MAG: DUF362 domain-containing protein [Oscillospiraceae bacterium]|nr:DUF362 domain-containing protein [Oscillospiraceae bacterium]
MSTEILFANMAYSRYDETLTLPYKFSRLLDESGLEDKVKGKTVAIKMHVGGGTSYSTIPPVFIRELARFINECGGDCFVTDHSIHSRRPENRGYAEGVLGCPVLDGCGFLNKYYYEKEVGFKSFRHVDIAGLIHDADFMIDLTHAKGHGSCAFGGACKNIAMGCVTRRTRHEIHGLEGGLTWDKDKCTRCELCIGSCNHYANKFDKNGDYDINFHHCTLCQHCSKVCPTGAIAIDGNNYIDFQHGLALCTKTVLDTFDKGNVYYITFLTQITALCDCWGMTTPSLVPDIGIIAGDDIAAIENAALDLIKTEDLISAGIPEGMELTGKGHLFEQLHGKDPYAQLTELEAVGAGNREYYLTEVK